MDDTRLLEEIYKLSKESTERDTRMETQLEYMEQRMTKQEELLASMSAILSEYKHLNATVEQMDYTEKDMAERLRRLVKRVEALERRPEVTVFRAFKYVLSLIISSVVGGVVVYLLSKLGIKGGN
jgi:uncharacterized coiled-coil protein SlyX